jgi:hypothetical protein
MLADSAILLQELRFPGLFGYSLTMQFPKRNYAIPELHTPAFVLALWPG